MRSWRSTTRAVWAAGALLGLGFVYAVADRDAGILPWHRLGSEVERAEARVLALRARNARLSAEIRALREDPLAKEAAIREVIGWVRPGEIRIQIDGESDTRRLPPPH